MDVSDIDLRSVDHVLTTTRAVRRRLDLGRRVERELIERCIDIAIQAPTALHGETWHFVVITEQPQRTAVAQVYRRAGEGRSGALSLDPYLASLRAEKPDDPRFAAQPRMFRSGAPRTGQFWVRNSPKRTNRLDCRVGLAPAGKRRLLTAHARRGPFCHMGRMTESSHVRNAI
jgi:nitroreductase